MAGSTKLTKKQPSPQVKVKDARKKKSAAVATTLGTGEYLTAVLLAVAPTALGTALAAMDPKNQNPSSDDWTKALNTGGDSPAVNAALLTIVTSAAYTNIITALRTPVPLLNNDVQKTPVLYSNGTAVVLDYVSFVRGLVMTNATNLTTPWGGVPPHPAGQDLLNLMCLLSQFRESA